MIFKVSVSISDESNPCNVCEDEYKVCFSSRDNDEILKLTAHAMNSLKDLSRLLY